MSSNQHLHCHWASIKIDLLFIIRIIIKEMQIILFKNDYFIKFKCFNFETVASESDARIETTVFKLKIYSLNDVIPVGSFP